MGRLKKHATEIVLFVFFASMFGFLFLTTFVSYEEPIDVRKAGIFITEIETALSRHQIDHGNYPVHTGDPELGGSILHEFLTNQFEPYLARGATGEHTKVINGQPTLVDYWGNPIHYRAFPPDSPENERDTRNPTYDLWSTGRKPKDPETWITNWRQP